MFFLGAMLYGVYIHFPYCIHKCSYCDFYSVENLNSTDRFIDNLCKEIELRMEHESLGKVDVETLFIGGGTPSLMKPKQIEKLVNTLENHFEFLPNAERTIECNPGTADMENFKAYKQLNFNRMSMGVQSFNQAELNFLERIHSPEEVFDAFELARSLGFENISLDLIFAIPGQTLETLDYTLDRTLECKSDHISAYSLIYEPGTPLYTKMKKGKVIPQVEDNDIAFYNLINERLTDAGFEQYEVSNYAKPGKRCKHNLKYWHGENYFAFGPSAHGYIGDKRYKNFRSNHKYFKLIEAGSLPNEETEILSNSEKMFERVFLELRADGLDTVKFKNDFGLDLWQERSKDIQRMEENGFLSFEDSKIKLSKDGYFVGDNVSLAFIDLIEELSGKIWRK